MAYQRLRDFDEIWPTTFAPSTLTANTSAY
ncbi:hypothetical protein VD0001_g5272 [Verticillium dahliae]|nr:hypothetical protein VD0001_g5272 [Verticillium dahliae]